MQSKINIFWFRRDLRLNDQAGLYHALKSGLQVLPVFIFDKNILNHLSDKKDRRVNFIYTVLEQLQQQLEKEGSTILVYYGTPEEVFKTIVEKWQIDTVFTNHDYEPYARKRDEDIKSLLADFGVQFKSFKDQVIFEKDQIVKDDGRPYLIYTPYSNKWKQEIKKETLNSFHCSPLFHRFCRLKALGFPSMKEMGFERIILQHDKSIPEEIILNYDKTRNIPSLLGTSRLGIHLRFGTMSIRKLVSFTLTINETYLNELIWREFFMQMLWHQPRLEKEPCKKEYEFIEWVNNETEFKKWCEGKTGYPIVDAGMRELNETGFMHNRVRMITASFLVKHLLIDWRWGEAYFAEKLNDYELSSNNGNWQWVAGCGCDAAPYFRIFNPLTQTKRFDPDLKYINKWIPELNSFHYPLPIVEHNFARRRCLDIYKKALLKAQS